MLDFILILRVTRIFKVFHAIPRFRTVLNTLVDILPSLLTYGSIVFVVYYFFAIIGMELFQVNNNHAFSIVSCFTSLDFATLF